jgi:hypothetical protein
MRKYPKRSNLYFLYLSEEKAGFVNVKYRLNQIMKNFQNQEKNSNKYNLRLGFRKY